MKRSLLISARTPFLIRFFCTKNSNISIPLRLSDHQETTVQNPPSKHFSPQEVEFLKASVSDVKVAPLPSGNCSTHALSIIHVIKTYNDDLGDKSHKFLRQFRHELDENLVVDVVANVKNVGLGVKFFLWAGRQIGYTHTAAVYDALLELLACNGKERVQDCFLHELRAGDQEALERLLNVLISKCCCNGMWNLALEELGRLKEFGYKPSRATYRVLIRVFLEVGHLDTACILQKEMSQCGFVMDVHILGSFVFSLCKVGKWRDALEIIEKEGVVPDTVLYTRMIAGLCEASLFEEAMDFLTTMRANSCVPNISTYKSLLCGYLNKGKLDSCKRILRMMIDEGCYPTPNILNLLVNAYCKTGGYSYAYKLLKKMVDCGCKPGYVAYNILIGSCCDSDELPSPMVLEFAEKAYREMFEAGISLNRVNVINFARCLCGVGKHDKAFSVIHEMMRNGFIPDAGTYNNVITFLCDAAKVEKALLLFQEMKMNKIVPNVYTYSILIDRFCKAGLIAQARCWFDEMIREGCMPDVVTYTSSIHAYLKARKISSANELFEMMLSQGCSPNIVTFSALIDGYCKGGDLERACAIYQKMRDNINSHDIDMYFRIASDSSTEPNVITYGALVDGLCKAHRVKEAQNLLDAMEGKGCKPNHIVYDALIDGFCKLGKLDESQEVLTKMSEHGYMANQYTYSSLIDRMFKDKRLDLVSKLLAKMLESSCSPNVVVYTVMVDGLCKVGKTGEAYKLMLMMEGKGCKPNVVTYTAMLDGLGKAGEVDKSLELFQEMVKKGCAPDYITYTVLIRHCCDAGRLDEAYQLLQEMKQTHWPIDFANHRKVIEGFSKEFLSSLQLVDEMGSTDYVPPVPLVYKVLIDSFQKSGKLEMALQLHKELSSLPISPSKSYSNSLSSLLSSLSAAHRVDEAFELYADMTRKGEVPELGLFLDLIKALVKDNRWEDALLLSESISYTDVQWLSNT